MGADGEGGGFGGGFSSQRANDIFAEMFGNGGIDQIFAQFAQQGHQLILIVSL
jgi:hypothetical protein